MKKLRSMYAAAAVVLPLTLTMFQPATAATPHADVAVIQGSGTIDPALGTAVEAHSVSFTGTATVVGTDGVLATYACSFNGVGTGNILGGPGTVSGGCGPLVLELCVFVLTGAVVHVACPKTTAAQVGIGQGECVFRPHQILPVESYDLTCEASLGLVEL